jgi:K+-transporting ATPase ATPase C chain
MSTVRLVLVTLLGCAVLYPLAVLAVAWAVAPMTAEGSLLRDAQGRVVGSRLLAQGFSRDDYLWPRPSAVGYDATAAGGSNLAGSNPELRVRAEAALSGVLGPMGAAPVSPVPAELVTASGSGLDPHVTLAGALWQAPRIARARHVAVARVEEVLHQQASAPSWGRPALVVVLEANLALDRELGRAPQRLTSAAASP